MSPRNKLAFQLAHRDICWHNSFRPAMLPATTVHAISVRSCLRIAELPSAPHAHPSVATAPNEKCIRQAARLGSNCTEHRHNMTGQPCTLSLLSLSQLHAKGNSKDSGVDVSGACQIHSGVPESPLNAVASIRLIKARCSAGPQRA
jgi:hypothetical protein